MEGVSHAVLEREGLSELGDRTLRDIADRAPDASDVMRYTIRMTSGTTGRAPIVIANEHRPGDARGFDGYRSLVICMGGNNTRLANVLLARASSTEPIRILPMDDRDVDSALTPLLGDLQPDCFRGFTSFVLRAGAYLGEAAAGVRLMKLSGEKWTSTLQEDFSRAFPSAMFEVLYITNEVGVLATRDCALLQPGFYHPARGVAVEVDAPDGSGIGDILVSKTFYRDVRVERYRVGDLARLSAEPCACGQPSFELVGRRGSDYLKVAGAVLLREEFDRVAVLCRDLFDDYRAEASTRSERGERKGAIVLTVFRRDGCWSVDVERAIGRRFSRELFLTSTRTLAELVAAGLFLPLIVKRAEHAFPLKNKEVKLTERTAAS